MKLRINSSCIDFSDDWDGFKRWIDGTYGTLPYTWVDEGTSYSIIAVDDVIQRLCSIEKVNAAEFEQLFKRQVSVRAPVAADGKPFVLPNIFPGEVLLNFAGACDNTSTGRRLEGPMFAMSVAPSSSEDFDITLLDGVFLAGGNLQWTGGHLGSEVYLKLLAPASTVKAPTVEGQGNCNLIPTGLGFNMIVPAAGNGQYDVDYAVPIPAYNEETNQQTGFWRYTEPWVGKGTVWPGAPGNSKYNLFDAPLELAHMARVALLLPSGQRDMIAPAIKPKWVLPEWTMCITVVNASSDTTLTAAWDLLLARVKSV